MPALIAKGVDHAKELKPLKDSHVWKTIKQQAALTKGTRLGWVGFDFFRALPFQAMKDIIKAFRHIEEVACIPNQWAVSLIALLPKNADIERPISLVASMYRLWCRLRAPYTRQ